MSTSTKNIIINALLGLMVLIAMINIIQTYLFYTDPAYVNKLSYISHMQHDGAFYIHNGKEMALTNNYVKAPEVFHGPYMQVFVSHIFRIFEQNQVRRVKDFLFLFWLLSGVLLFFIGDLLFKDKKLALLGSCLFYTISVMQKFVSMIAYENLALFLVTLSVFLVLKIDKKWSQILLGFILAVLFAVRVSFAFNFVAVALFLFVRDRKIKNYFWLIGSYVLFMLVWVIANEGKLLPPFLEERFAWVNTNEATGVSWPHTGNKEVSGFKFMLLKPFSFIALVFKRFLFLTGITPDIIYVRPNFTKALEFIFRGDLVSQDIWVEIMCTLSFLLGAGMLLWGRVKKQLSQNLDLLLFMFIPNFLLLILWGMTPRHMIPIFPIVILIQLYGFKRLFGLVQDRLS